MYRDKLNIYMLREFSVGSSCLMCICEPLIEFPIHRLRFFRCSHFCNSFLFSCLFVRIYLSSPNRQPFAIVRHCWWYVCIAESEFRPLYDTRKVIRTRKGPPCFIQSFFQIEEIEKLMQPRSNFC